MRNIFELIEENELIKEAMLKNNIKKKDLKMYQLKKGLIVKLFSRDIEWGEWEAIQIKNFGWLFYQVEDTAGSITIFVSKNEISEPIYNSPDVTTFKLSYAGSYGNEKGIGVLYWELKDNIYRKKISFNSYAEGYTFLEKELFKI